jgi:hypothetical protein
LSGDLSAYNVFFEAQGTQHLMKVASVVHRRQQHVCGNRVKVLPKGVLAQVTGKDTKFAGRDFGSKVVNTPDGQIKVEQGWELKWHEPSCKKLAQEGGASVNAQNYCLFASHYMGA